MRLLIPQSQIPQVLDGSKTQLINTDTVKSICIIHGVFGQEIEVVYIDEKTRSFKYSEKRWDQLMKSMAWETNK